MKTYRITFEAVFDIEADSDEEAWAKIPENISVNDGYLSPVSISLGFTRKNHEQKTSDSNLP